MRYAFIILLGGLLAKDILPLGDRYVLRGVSEGIALAVGIRWLLAHRIETFAKRYALIVVYVATLSLTALVSQRPVFVILQVISLASVIVFFIAYIESSRLSIDTVRWNLLTVSCAFLLVCAGSLILIMARPELVFEITPEGNRFRGVFNEPAMMGAVSGLLLGLVAFGEIGWFVRVAGALAAIPCLYLTGSRTSWGAAIAGLIITGVIHIRRNRAWMIASVFVGIIGVLSLTILDIRLNSDTQSKIVRSGSIGTLSGRTVLWNLAFEKYLDSPFLGYGFTTGSDALESDMGDMLSTAFGVSDRSRQKAFSLHSGYIQAFLDSGAIGASLYMFILGLAIWRLFKYDQNRLHGAEMYSLVFFGVSNFTDTIIFGAAVFYEVFYWYLSALGIRLGALAPEISAESSNRSLEEGAVLLKSKNDFTSENTRQYPLLQE